MHALESLPHWALYALALIGLAAGFGILYIAAVGAAYYTELHEFKVRVITIRNEHLQRLEALITGNDPTGAASAMFNDEVPSPASQQASPPATKQAA